MTKRKDAKRRDAGAAAAATLTVIDRPDVAGGVTHYAANRPPLAPSPLVRLPLGAVMPSGWLRRQLELQATGFHGRLGGISRFLGKENNSWLSATGVGEHGWEEVPYWLRGYMNCAYLLDDAAMLDKARVWIEGALASRKPDGWFGPDKGRTGEATEVTGRDDLWPNMIMLFCLRSYYERTGDPRVVELATAYFRYLLALPEEKFLIGYWPRMRGGDQLLHVLWLYNVTGEPWLLELAHKTHRRTARWDTDVINWHNVNVAQCFREPATYWQLSGEADHLAATERDWRKARELYGHVPGGMFGADENARPGYDGPRQGVETCGIAEEMLSDELLIAVTGDPAWAGRCENAAFNSLPATMTADMKALRYFVAPNQPQSDGADKSPGIQNHGAMYRMDPHSHRCCQHNAGMAWPYLVQHLWYAAAGDGLAAYLYGPCKVTAKVAGGAEARIVETTRYPFEDKVALALTLDRPSRFPLYLRIPSWCEGAGIAINGSRLGGGLPAGKLARIDREWRSGDRVELQLPMTTHVERMYRGAASVSRGPLTYSLDIEERRVRAGGTDEWPAWDLFPASPWNCGLVLAGGDAKAAAAMEVVRGAWPEDEQPFSQDSSPVRLRARARRIPGWKLDAKGLVNEVVQSPVRSDEEDDETVSLVPMGAARLRISAFPVISDGPDAREWPEESAGAAPAAAPPKGGA